MVCLGNIRINTPHKGDNDDKDDDDDVDDDDDDDDDNNNGKRNAVPVSLCPPQTRINWPGIKLDPQL